MNVETIMIWGADMKISGFQSITLSDFPGQTAAIVFTQGCNFCCPFCHNHQLLDAVACPSSSIDVENVLQLLDRRKKMLDGLVITGGEPTLQSGLDVFIDRVKRLGLQVKLDTNGSRPDVIIDLLNKDLLDFIAMDIKAPLEKYGMLAGVNVNKDDIRKSIEIIVNSGIKSQFRTTFVPDLLDESDIVLIRQMIPAGVEYKIQTFIPENALDERLRKSKLAATA